MVKEICRPFLFNCLFVFFYLSIYVSVCLPVCPVCLSVDRSIYTFILYFIYLLTNFNKLFFYRKKISSFSWLRIWQLSMPEAWMICLAFVGVLVQGTIYPVFAVLFGQVLRVFTLPFNQVLQGIHVWAGMFLVLGLLSGTATFAKVHSKY